MTSQNTQAVRKPPRLGLCSSWAWLARADRGLGADLPDCNRGHGPLIQCALKMNSFSCMSWPCLRFWPQKKYTGRQKTAKAWAVLVVGMAGSCRSWAWCRFAKLQSWAWPTPTVGGLVVLSLHRCQRRCSLVYCLARLAVEFARSRRNLFGPVQRFCQYLQRSHCPRP